MFQPRFYFVENPWNGLLPKRTVVSQLPPPKKVSYCKYGYSYRKHTALWTSCAIEFHSCKNDCHAVHLGPRGRMRHNDKAQRDWIPLSKLQAIPPCLHRHICKYIIKDTSETRGTSELKDKENGGDREGLRGPELPGPRSTEACIEETGEPVH